MAADPFTQVLDYLWTTLEADAGFAVAFPVRNRIKLSGSDTEPYKDEAIHGADFPFCIIQPAGMEESDLWKTSDTTALAQAYDVMVATDERQVNKTGKGLFDLTRTLFRALSPIKGTGVGFTPVTTDETFSMQEVSISGAAQSLENDVLGKGVNGWTIVFQVVAVIRVDRSAWGG